jgi:hypothetical protein
MSAPPPAFRAARPGTACAGAPGTVPLGDDDSLRRHAALVVVAARRAVARRCARQRPKLGVLLAARQRGQAPDRSSPAPGAVLLAHHQRLVRGRKIEEPCCRAVAGRRARQRVHATADRPRTCRPPRPGLRRRRRRRRWDRDDGRRYHRPCPRESQHPQQSRHLSQPPARTAACSHDARTRGVAVTGTIRSASARTAGRSCSTGWCASRWLDLPSRALARTSPACTGRSR